ncbi:hypothetical protein [Mycobacterium parmense]|uniref:Uncharacterized protein n=1 Tax=Mycobacterium parmense TaxID=185642 RepID=A0A7I7YY87_9MYCO|nr:hypothetical protein [Mycobacterium parmense]BBZ45691.1 hypothetical protein MPRM_29720 [Mycobacterium parmense]
MRSILLWLMVLCGAVFLTPTARSAATPCQPAELFLAGNPDAPSELQADATILRNGASVQGSTPLDGVYWSAPLRQTASEPSREFHLCVPEGPTLHDVAEALRHQFAQEAVLTFDYLPQNAPGADAVAIRVPDVDAARLRAAFTADSPAHDRLLGASVTTTDHTLILVAAQGDLDDARRLIGEAGGDWEAATTAYGRREVVR